MCARHVVLYAVVVLLTLAFRHICTYATVAAADAHTHAAKMKIELIRQQIASHCRRCWLLPAQLKASQCCHCLYRLAADIAKVGWIACADCQQLTASGRHFGRDRLTRIYVLFAQTTATRFFRPILEQCSSWAFFRPGSIGRDLCREPSTGS